MRLELPMMLCVAMLNALEKNAHGSALAASDAIVAPSSGLFEIVASTIRNIIPAPTTSSGIKSAHAKPITACVYRNVMSRRTNCITRSRASQTSRTTANKEGCQRRADGGRLASDDAVIVILLLVRLTGSWAYMQVSGLHPARPIPCPATWQFSLRRGLLVYFTRTNDSTRTPFAILSLQIAPGPSPSGSPVITISKL